MVTLVKLGNLPHKNNGRKNCMSNKKQYSKIDLRAVPDVPACGCPFVNDDNVKCMNHVSENQKIRNKFPYQFVCVCNECEKAMQSRESDLVEIEA